MKTPAVSKTIAACGVMAAMATALAFLEGLLPSVGIPGARLGLANIAVTAALCLIGVGGGMATAAVKVLFVLVTRGVTASFLSLCGTTAAVAVTLLLMPLYKKQRMTFVGVCVSASAMHSLFQLLGASVMLSASVMNYAPLMLLVSVPTGILTGTILNGIIPRLTPALRRSVEKG